MISGGLILWNPIAICEMSKTSWQTGKHRMNKDLEHLMKGPIIPFGALVEHLPNSDRDKARNHQFGKKRITRIFSRICFDRGVILERRHSNC